MAVSRQLLRGTKAEALARKHLEQRGMHWITSNYRCKSGEIDLIMQDAEQLVFVEVRYRKSDSFGSALDSVTINKQKKIVAAANHYLQQTGHAGACRFDVVGLSGEMTEAVWLKDAFQTA